MSESTLEIPYASWLVPFLLLLVRGQGSYGHDLTRRVADLGFGDMRPGVMYRTLHQMEQEGMVLSERDGFDCRLTRRKYSIAEPGEAYLEFWADSLAEHRESMSLFLKMYAGEAVRGVQRMRNGPGRAPLEDSRPAMVDLVSVLAVSGRGVFEERYSCPAPASRRAHRKER